MPEIVITVRNKRATASVRSVVCDNTDYTLRFDFDEQWGEGPKTVFFVLQGVGALAPAVTDGDVCAMPAVHLNDGVGRQLAVGVQQGTVKTTTAAYFWCYPSAENELLNGIVDDDSVTMTWLEWVNANMAQAEVNVREAAQVLEEAEAAKNAAAGSAAEAAGSAEDAAASAESARANMQSAWSYKERAVGASVTAAEAKTAAESARDSAQYARTGAQTAQTAAETAKTAAQTAQAGAEAARDAAQTARTGAQAAQTAANTSKIAAQDAQAGAESAQAEAVAARTAAQAAQAGAEAAQAGAVAAKGEALTAIDGKKAEAIAAVQSAQSTAVTAVGTALAAAEDAIEDKGEEVIASIPEDYTELSGDVGELKTQLRDYKGTNLAQDIAFVDGKQIRSGTGVYATSTSLSAEEEFIDITGMSKIVYMRRVSNSDTEPTNGMAFYSTDNESGYISGIPSDYRSGGGNPYLYEADVPENARYARFTYLASNDPALQQFPFALYNAEEYNNSHVKKVDDNTENIAELTSDLNEVKSMLIYDDDVNFGELPTTQFYISPSNNKWASNADVESYFITLSTSVKKITITANNNANAYIAFLQDNNVVTGETPNYATGYSFRTTINMGTTETFDIPYDCEVIFVWGKNANSTFLPSNTILHYFSDVPAMEEDISRLKTYHPDYSNKKVSILGDSISTFCADDEKVTIDGHICAGEDCVTNYPGNIVKYSASDVVNVNSTWWEQVLDFFGMTLAINESWAGSCIGYNANETGGGKYTADNCLCSETRINHLDENGTPDIIMIFGGTNDINHHRIGNTNSLRYAVGELDITHNPYDYENFPVITDTYYGSITAMILRIQHKYPNATILMILPYYCTSTHTASGDIATPYDQNEWADAAIKVCDYLGVEYLDLRKIINLYDVSTLLFDGLHPKANGMAAIAKAVIHKLNSML